MERLGEHYDVDLDALEDLKNVINAEYRKRAPTRFKSELLFDKGAGSGGESEGGGGGVEDCTAGTVSLLNATFDISDVKENLQPPTDSTFTAPESHSQVQTRFFLYKIPKDLPTQGWKIRMACKQ